MDEFTKHYLIAALWSSHDDADESGGEPMDANYGLEDIAEEVVAAAQADCDRFRKLAGDMLDAGTEAAAAHDFWLTRNGHGAGFWDGDWPEHGDALTAICETFGEVDLYIGDDGRVY